MKKTAIAAFMSTAGVAAILALAPGVFGAQNNDLVLPNSSRLSPEQYRQSIIDIFGPAIKLNGRFEPGMREDGLHGEQIKRSGVGRGFGIRESAATSATILCR